MSYCSWDQSSELNIKYHDKNCPCYKKIVGKYPTVAKKRFLEKQVTIFGN